jgi:5-methylcytosine-specific restriction endonuclease McrA
MVDHIRWPQLRQRERDQIRAEVFRAKGALCLIQLAGCTGKATTVDHLIPDVDGGPHTVENLAPACRPCNQKRGASGMAYGTTTARTDVGPSRAW